MRSQTPYPPHVNLDFLETIKNFWETGVLDDYSENHFLIRAINNDISYFKDLFLRRHIGDIDPDIFPWHFIVNLDGKIKNFTNRFGSNEIENFFKNQFAAGKSSYNENQFFEALSEFHVLSFFANFGPAMLQEAIYEPRLGEGEAAQSGQPIAQSKRSRCSIPPVSVHSSCGLHAHPCAVYSLRLHILATAATFRNQAGPQCQFILPINV